MAAMGSSISRIFMTSSPGWASLTVFFKLLLSDEAVLSIPYGIAADEINYCMYNGVLAERHRWAVLEDGFIAYFDELVKVR